MTSPAVGAPNWADQTIWTGDNLDIMRGMNSASVDLIYLDPPFNSKANYAAPIGSEAAGAEFTDTWGLHDINLAWHGEIKHEHPGLYDLLQATRRIHSDSMMSYLIYMAPRIMEMRRLLRPTGSIYLHCDQHAGHYLKLLMDAIFGRNHFYSDITWKRTSAHNDKVFGNVSDKLLCYGSPPRYGESAMVGLDQAYIEGHYRFSDHRGRYSRDNLTGPRTSSGESGEPWKGADPGARGRCWSVPRTGGYAEYLHEVLLPGYLDIQGVHARLDALEEAGMIHWPSRRGSMPRLKRYLRDGQKQLPSNLLTDIPPYPRGRESTTDIRRRSR